jgi:hypothetical protein
MDWRFYNPSMLPVFRMAACSLGRWPVSRVVAKHPGIIQGGVRGLFD